MVRTNSIPPPPPTPSTLRKDAGPKEPTVGYDVPRPSAEPPRTSHTSVRPPAPAPDAADRWSSTLSGVSSPVLPASTVAAGAATSGAAPGETAPSTTAAAAPPAATTLATATASTAAPPAGMPPADTQPADTPSVAPPPAGTPPAGTPSVAPPPAPAPPAASPGGASAAPARDEPTRELEPLASALGSGIRAASRRMLDGPGDSLESRLPGAPRLLGADALDAVARRLSAESELWRRMALRAQDRIATAERIGYAIGGVTLFACLGLGVVAAFGGLFAGDSAGPKALLVLGGALTVAIGAALGYAFTHGVRARQTAVINAAMTRADRADAELRRLGVAAALRSVDAGAYRDALLRSLADDARR